MRDALDFTVDDTRFGGLPDYVTDVLKPSGIKFVTILDPCISTGEGDSYEPYRRGNDYLN